MAYSMLWQLLRSCWMHRELRTATATTRSTACTAPCHLQLAKDTFPSPAAQLLDALEAARRQGGDASGFVRERLARHVAAVEAWLPRVTCAIVGPGMGDDPLLCELVKHAIRKVGTGTKYTSCDIASLAFHLLVLCLPQDHLLRSRQQAGEAC